MTMVTTKHPGQSWLGLGLSGATTRDARRKRRARGDSLRRLECLEDRTLLNASLDISLIGNMTYNMDPATAEVLHVSVDPVTGIYTFSSDQNIDVTNADPVLFPTTGDGGTTVTVDGPLASLDVAASQPNDTLDLYSTNVTTAINLNSSGALVTLGDAASTNGLGALTAPVTVTGPGSGTSNYVALDDSGSPTSNSYFIAGTNVTSFGAFAGLNYSGISNLTVYGAAGNGGSNAYYVNGTADGVATTVNGFYNTAGSDFYVYGTSADPNASLTLYGGAASGNIDAFNLYGASSDILVGSTGDANGFSNVYLGNGGDTSGLTGAVVLQSFGGQPFYVNVNDYNGPAGDNWNLAAQASPSTLSELTGFSVGGSLVYDPTQVNGFSLTSAVNQSNLMTVDFSNGSPLPTGGASPYLNYDGTTSFGFASDLVLIGALPSGPVGSETHLASGSGSGNIAFSDGVGSIFYNNISPYSLYDTVPATDYTFDDSNDPDGNVGIYDGVNSPLTGNVQSLLISSLAGFPSFANTYVANKANVTFTTSTNTSTNTTVNFGAAGNPEGLLSLSLVGNSPYQDVFNVNAASVPVTATGSNNGASYFYVNGATTPVDLVGGDNYNSFNVQSTTAAVNITGGNGSNNVFVGNGGVTSGVTGTVTLVSAPVLSPFYVSVDDSAGTAGDTWNLAAQASPSTLSELTGFSVGGSLVYDPTQVNNLSLNTANNQTNLMTVDFSNGSPLPTGGGGGGLHYYGGYPTTDSGSDLVLMGALPSGPIGTETHNVYGAGSGNIGFPDLASSLSYDGISPHSVYDTVPATNYIFNDTNDPDGRVVIRDGVNNPMTNGFQTMLITSLGVPPSFADTYLANKTNVTANIANGGEDTETTVDFNHAVPVVDGLSTLTVATAGGPDSAIFRSLPVGVTTNLLQRNDQDRARIVIFGTDGTTATNLDGGLGYDYLIVDASGLPITPANFAPGVAPGSTVISGAPLPGGDITYVNYDRVYVANLPAAPPVVTGSTFHAVQGQRLDDAVVGTFTSAAVGAKAGDFSSTIDWGDGSHTAGVIVQDASNPSVFYVMGTHTYAENDPAITTHVTIVSAGSETTILINGIPTTFITPAGDPVTADGTAIVANAPITVTAGSFSGFENITPNPADVFVATFTDQGGVNPILLDPASRYSVLINWGDGTAPLPVPTSAITQNGSSNSYTVIVPQHVYHTPGSYVVTVTVSDGGPDAVVSTATGVATIADAPLTPALIQPVIAPATEGVLINAAQLVSFNDANPLSQPTDFLVSIDWGDGSPMSAGWLVQPGGVGTTYYVAGSHTYTDAMRAGAPPVAWGPGPIAGPLTAVGTFPIHVYVQDTYGSAVNLATTINVNDNPITVSGALNASSDSGLSNSDAITNVTQPNFQGTISEASGVVWLYATKPGGSPVLIAQVAADATGAWNVNSYISLTDGSYAIQAQAYDATGHTVSALTTVTPNLVIDTVGPKVTDLYFDNQGGQVLATFQDYGGVNNAGAGMNQASLIDANNYRFSFISSPVKGYRAPAQWIVGGIEVQPGGTTGPQYAAIKINDGRGIRGGRYLFTVNSADPSNKSGVQDIAGNALDGEFYSFFPSGNNVNGGNFTAELDAVHHTVYAPKTTIGTASPVTPPGTRGVNNYVTRYPRALPRASAAVRLSAARTTAAQASAHAPARFSPRHVG